MKFHYLTLIILTVLPLSSCDRYTTINGIPAYHHGFGDDNKGYNTPIAGADKVSFHVIHGSEYAKDKRSVYFRGLAVDEADPHTFTALPNGYGKDANRGFYDGQPIQGSDGKTFETLPGGWARDQHDVYAGAEALHACDPRTFRNLDGHWHVDSRCAYYGNEKISYADAATFQSLGDSYAKDERNVYWNGRIILDADPLSFHLTGLLCQVCARDNYQCYTDGEITNCSQPKHQGTSK